jgi:hypothetical protein
MRAPLLFVLAACAHTAPTTAPASPAAALPDPPGYTLDRTGDLHDFDFIAGGWTVENQRLVTRGAGSHQWDAFPAVDCGQVLLGNVVNVDELHFPTKGWAGVTVRNFDVARKQWSIYWISSRDGKLYPPVHGGFAGDRGEFYGTDDDNGRPVKVRFVWTKAGPDRATWEQSFSYDGKTWEPNWRNQFTRADPATTCDAGRPRQ